MAGLAKDLAEQFGPRRTGTFIETAEDAHEMYVRLRGWYRNRTEWVVSIESGDRLYDAALRWFYSSEAQTRPPRQVKAVLKRSARPRLEDFYDGVGRAAKPSVELLYDERGKRAIYIGGHKVSVVLSKTVQEHGGMGGGEQPWRPSQRDSIHFYCKSQDARAAVITQLERIVVDQQKSKPALHLMTNWGDWDRRDDLPERQLSSVVLAEGQMERLRDDLQGFLDAESQYTRRGMPYHRGYLLYGPPGTGKTSIVRALAAHFGLDLWYAPLGDLQKDTNLLTLINQVKPGSILLLEDVDVFQATQDRKKDEDKDSGGVSLAGLLNALDGVATPHGLITFLTTNDKSVLDPAILRPGRIDVQEEIGMPDRAQVARLYETWFDLSLPQAEVAAIAFTGSTAGVVEVLKQHMEDPVGALVALQKPPAGVEDRSVTVTALKGKRDERSERQASRKPGH